MKHKKLFVSLTAIFTVLVFFSIFSMMWFLGDDYKNFESFKEEFEIPGLKDGAVPQGIGSCEAEYYVYNAEVDKTEAIRQQYYFISAYMADGSPSRIYVTGEKTGYVGYVTLKNEDGEDFYGHCGGIAINNQPGTSSTSAKYYTLWVTGESMVHCAKSSEEYQEKGKSIAQEIVEKAETKGSVQFTASFKANCKASFCFYYDDPTSTGTSSSHRLYVGEFYRKGNFETDKKHWMTTPNGYQNTAVMYEYYGDSSSKYGLQLINKRDGDGLAEEDRVPRVQKIFSLPEQIQGVAYSGKKNGSSNDGTLVLSQSYGLKNSHLLCFNFNKIYNSRKRYVDITGESFAYEGVKKTFGENVIDYTESDIYVYYVDKNDKEMFINDYSIPSMSEGLCVPTPATSSNGAVNRVFVLFESGSKKYKYFVRQKVKSVYSFLPKEKISY